MVELHVFVDESGELGFSDNSSKKLILSFVFHDARDDISNDLRRISGLDYFHLGPLVRREFPYKDDDLEARIRIFRKFFAFSVRLPIKCKSFMYDKSRFNGSEAILEKQIFNDLSDFFSIDHPYFRSFDSIIIYYDKGQRKVSQIIDRVLSHAGFNYSFKPGVKAEKYRLSQVADLITSLKLVESKMQDDGMRLSEIKFFGKPRQFKKNYLRAIEKKEIPFEDDE